MAHRSRSSRSSVASSRASYSTIAGEDKAGTSGDDVAAPPPEPRMPPRPQSKSKVTLDDNINLEILMRLKKVFDDADTDKGGTLDEDEFVHAFSGVIGDEHTGPKELRQMFMKIDANASGDLDWEEFSAFMLLSSQGRGQMRNKEQVPQILDTGWRDKNHESAAHRDLITKIVRVPGDRYASGSRDGTVRLWGCLDLMHQRTIQCCKSWISDICFLPCHKKLAVAACNRMLYIYDLATFEVVGKIMGLEHVPLTLDCRKEDKSSEDLLLIGDDGGYVHLYSIVDKDVGDMRLGEKLDCNRIWKHRTHTDWVTKVKHIPDLSCVASSSLDRTIVLIDPERRTPPRSLSGHGKGIYSFAWSKNHKIIISCGLDRHLVLWNPFSGQPLASLHGHTSCIQDVIVHDGHNQIVSVGVDKSMRVWDIRSHKCIQVMIDKAQYRPENRIGAIMFDPARSFLITGATRLKPWPLKTLEDSFGMAHATAVTAALYNASLEQVVSGDQSSIVCVWDLATGKLTFRFASTPNEGKITAMSFDSNKRRLLIGFHDGSVKMWNPNNGECLKELASRTSVEVTGLANHKGGYQSRQIIGVGWNRKVTLWEEADRRILYPIKLLPGHHDDILTLAVSPPYTLATGAHDGTIILWNIDSGAIRCKLTPPYTEGRPPHERSVEKVAFFNGPKKNLLCSCGADGMIRVWDSIDGTLASELDAQHKAGESLVGLAISQDNAILVTGDATGYLKVWDTSRYQGRRRGGASNDVEPEAFLEGGGWKAHAATISSIEVVDRDALILTASADTFVSLWSLDGQIVGHFGRDTWILSDRATWRSERTSSESVSRRNSEREGSKENVESVGGKSAGFTGRRGFDFEEDPRHVLRSWAGSPSRPQSSALYEKRVYRPKGDEALNHCLTEGRPSSSIAHLLHIQGLKDLGSKPARVTPSAGRAIHTSAHKQGSPNRPARPQTAIGIVRSSYASPSDSATKISARPTTANPRKSTSLHDPGLARRPSSAFSRRDER